MRLACHVGVHRFSVSPVGQVSKPVPFFGEDRHFCLSLYTAFILTAVRTCRQDGGTGELRVRPVSHREARLSSECTHSIVSLLSVRRFTFIIFDIPKIA